MADAWAALGDRIAGDVVYGLGLLVTVMVATRCGPRLAARIRRSALRLRSTVPLLSFAFALPISSLPAGASERHVVTPRRAAAASPPPWSGPGGSSSSPLPARAGEPAEGAEQPWAADARAAEEEPAVEATPKTHPAIHGKQGAKVTPLFPRVTRRAPDPEVRRREREESMRRHPSGKGRSQVTPAGDVIERPARKQPSSSPRRGDHDRAVRYSVRQGDTLWSIAEKHLDTTDVRRIARYWPRIHRANRSLIQDPNLIRPGWTLLLPPEVQR
jgi:nucleoid-associated protein YgaU